MRRTHFSAVSLFVVLSVLAISASAQFKAGLQGTLTDSSGATVSGATVLVVNDDTKETRSTVSTESGFYRVFGLPPGKYTVTVGAASFGKSETHVVVMAEELKGLDVVLKPRTVSESVTVTANAISLQTEDANVVGSITTNDLQRLPQVNRDPYSLIHLAPGILGDTSRAGIGNQAQFMPGTENLVGASNVGIFAQENQVQISANGQRVSSNNFEIDGVGVNALELGGAAVVTPSQDAVEEVRIVTSSYSAEDGRNTGAQVKVVSKSGTNAFHGTGTVVFDDRGLNAFNKYTGSTLIAPSQLTCQDGVKVFASACPQRVDNKQRLFSGAIGGPVIKNKLFFFFSYEGLRRHNVDFLANQWIETPEFRQYVNTINPNSLAAKLFSMPGEQPRIITSGLTPLAPPNGIARMGQLGLGYDVGSINQPLGSKIPGGTPPAGIPEVTLANLAQPSTQDGNQYHGRADYDHGKDHFAGSFFISHLDQLAAAADSRPMDDQNFRPRNTASTVTWVRTISSTMLNEARVNFTRFYDNEIQSVGPADLAVPKLDTNGFNFAGGPSLGLPGGGGLQWGIDRGVPKVLTQNTYEFRDTFSTVHRSHALKFGFGLTREQDNSDRRNTARPEYAFDNFLSFGNDAPFFENAPDVNPATGATPNSKFYYRTTDYAAFVQDDWKFRRNLTFNVGLRYEYQTPVTEKNGRLTNFILGPGGLTPAGIAAGKVMPVSSLYNPDRSNFSPRLGFAWSPDRFHDRVVVRGGFGLGYDHLFLNLVNNSKFNPPYSAGGIGLCCDAGGGILYAFGDPSTGISFPANPALQSGIDPRTGGLLAPSPTNLPGGFVRNDQYIEVNGTPADLPRSRAANYSLELQYQPVQSVTVSLGYNGSVARHLIRTIDLNRMFPGDAFNCIGCVNNKDMVQVADVNGNPITPRLTGNPNFDRIFFPLADANSSYNAMVLHIRKTTSHGLFIDANYRYAKSIDTSSFGRGTQQTDPSNQIFDRGPSDFDVRHNFVLTSYYDLPFFRKRHDWMGKSLGGWQINGVLTAHTGFPWTPQEGCCFFGTPGGAANDINGDGIGNDFPTQWDGKGGAGTSNQSFMNGVFPKDSAHPNGGFDYFNIFPGGACPNFPVDCITAKVRGPNGIGRNRFRGPAFRQLDMTLGKQTGLPQFMHLGEGANLNFRANFFNILNTLNLPSFQTGGQSNTDFTNGNDFGRALTGLAGRVVEFQLRLSF